MVYRYTKNKILKEKKRNKKNNRKKTRRGGGRSKGYYRRLKKKRDKQHIIRSIKHTKKLIEQENYKNW